MNSISRRQALQGTGFAVALPLTSSLLPHLAFAQTASKPATAASLNADTVNPDLLSYVNDTLAQVVAAQAKGEGIVDFSDAIRLLAGHIDDLGIDDQFMPAMQQVISGGPLSFSNPLTSPPAVAANDAVQKYYPGFDITQSPLAQMGTDQVSLQQAFNHLGSVGFGNALRTVADTVRMTAMTGTDNLRRTSFEATRVAYRASKRPHLQLVAECSAADKRKLVADCNALAALSATAILAAGVLACLVATVGVGAAFCALILTGGGLFVTGALLATITAYLFAQCATLGI